MHPYILLYKTLFPWKYRHYMELAGGDCDKCHETLLHGTFYEEYDLYRFGDKSEAERREYLTDAERDRICRRVNSRSGERTVADKWKTYQRMKPFYRRQVILPNDDASRQAVIALGEREGRLVAKPANQCGGRGVELLQARTREEWAHLLAEHDGCLFEQCIHQDEATARWNADSVNTVRINTFRRGNEVDFFTSFIRTGRKGTFVDNGAQGGIFASIDEATGRVITDGYDEHGNVFLSHPDSGTRYQGEQLPRWEELLTLARNMALAMDGMTYIGWDMALTPDGWEPVEANRGEFVAQQVTLGRGMRREFMKRCGIGTRG